jgi:methyl-accepting chemotaxis protein
MSQVRKQYLVKEFQIKFVVRFCLLVLLAVVVFAIGLYLWTGGTVTTAFENSRLEVKTTRDFIWPIILVMTLVSVTLVAIASWFLLFLLVHRIAGPIHRVENHLSHIGEGELSHQIFLRSNDEIQELAGSVNDMMTSLASRLNDLKKDFCRLEKIDRDLVLLWEGKRVGHKKLEPVIKEFKEIGREIQLKLDSFKT